MRNWVSISKYSGNRWLLTYSSKLISTDFLHWKAMPLPILEFCGFFEVHTMISVREGLDLKTSARKLLEYRCKVIQFWTREVVMTIEQKDKRDISKEK